MARYRLNTTKTPLKMPNKCIKKASPPWRLSTFQDPSPLFHQKWIICRFFGTLPSLGGGVASLSSKNYSNFYLLASLTIYCYLIMCNLCLYMFLLLLLIKLNFCCRVPNTFFILYLTKGRVKKKNPKCKLFPNLP